MFSLFFVDVVDVDVIDVDVDVDDAKLIFKFSALIE